MASSTAEQLKRLGDSAWDERWRFVTDTNSDGVVTITDMFNWIQWIFFAPGDWVILMLIRHLSDVAVFLEISPDILSGLFSGIVSAIAWLIAWSIWSAFTN